MIVAGLAIAREAFQSRAGVAAMTALVGALALGWMYLHYEGLPIGPLRYIPGIHYVFPEGKIERVKREAVKGLVLKTELDAANAKLAERERQMTSAAIAAGRADALYQASEQARRAQEQADVIEDAAYEKRLRESGRSCSLDQSDIDWLRK
jgi:hypothetical protein